MKLNRFAIYSWGVLGYHILIILWGAAVRATGSGDGCGQQWLTCQGSIIPYAPQIETIIEYAHRLTSGIAVILVLALVIWSFRKYPPKHHVRFGAVLSFVFLIIEALIGAVLVLFGLVGDNASIARVIVVGLHLVNTFILLTVLTLTAWWASAGKPIQLRGQGIIGWSLIAGYIAMLILGASGAVTALGDTLFPAGSLVEGIRQDFLPTAHFLIQLRLYHPLIAILVGAYLIMTTGIFNASRPTPNTRRFAKLLTIIYFVQLLAGALNIILLVPIWMQLIHLLLADLILIIFTLFLASAFAQPAENRQSISIEAAPRVTSS